MDSEVQLKTSQVHLLGLLLGELGQFLEHLGEVLSIILTVLLLALGSRLGHNHHNTGGAFRGGGVAELSSGCDEDVGDTVVLTQDRDVRDNVHGRDIGGENDDTVGDTDAGVGSGNGRLAESLDDLLDTALQALVDGSYYKSIR